LTQANAGTTYLKQSDATNTYLKQSDATNTYLPKLEAGTTYLTQVNAGTTYLKQSDATNTYLKQSDANVAFANIRASMTGAFANIRESMTGAFADVKSSITGAFANGFISKLCMTGPAGTTCISQAELSQLKISRFRTTDPKPSIFFKRITGIDETGAIVYNSAVFNDYIDYDNKNGDIIGYPTDSKVYMFVRSVVSNGQIIQQGYVHNEYDKLFMRRSNNLPTVSEPTSDTWTPWKLVNSDNYLSKTDAASTYLTQANANNYVKYNDNIKFFNEYSSNQTSKGNVYVENGWVRIGGGGAENPFKVQIQKI
jgi:hypothetical protein